MSLIPLATEVIQQAFNAAAKNRTGRSFEAWSKDEIQAVWSAARDFAQQHGLRTPLITEVEQGERLAMGHSDYGVKWALFVAQKMH